MSESKYDGRGKAKEKLLPAKVLIGVPSGAEWKADFGMALISVFSYCHQTKVEGWSELTIAIQNSKGSILSQVRNNIVKRALEMDATHVLFLDDDMTFPPFVLHSLLEHKQKVVACNCVTKTIPANPTARMKSSTKIQGEPIWLDDKDEAELQKVWRVGTGVMLIETSVFKEIERPYFDIRYNHEVDDYVGEDWRLCERLEEKGIPIYIDRALSHTIGHIGPMNYGHEHSVVGEDTSSPILIPK